MEFEQYKSDYGYEGSYSEVLQQYRDEYGYEFEEEWIPKWDEEDDVDRLGAWIVWVDMLWGVHGPDHMLKSLQTLPKPKTRVLSLKGTDAIKSKGVDELVEFRKGHILNRHRYGAGKPGKTEFPSEWSDDKIIDEINKIANNPKASGGIGKWNSPFKIGTVDGVEISMDFYPSTHPHHAGKVSTAYPTNIAPNPTR